MDKTENEKIWDDILFRAEKTVYYSNLVIQQCDSWLSAEEGNANMLRKIEERKSSKFKIQKSNLMSKSHVYKILRRFKRVLFALMIALVATSCNKDNQEEIWEEARLTTAEVTFISDDGATAGGVIIDEGVPAYTERGVCFAADVEPTIADHKAVVPGSGTGSFTTVITGLEAGTKYYIRAYATNKYGTVYGNAVIFVIFLF